MKDKFKFNKSHLKVMDMLCDNCGAEINKKEEYCPNCGMELPGSAPKPSKKKYHRDSAAFTRDIPHPKVNYENHYNEEADYEIKPLKRKYYGNPSASAYDDPYYQEEVNYESYYAKEDDYETKKSGGLLGTIFLLLVIALLLGFIIGLILFSSNIQSIPNVPNLNS